MSDIVVFIPKQLSSEWWQHLSEALVSIATAQTMQKIIVTQIPSKPLSETMQNFFKEQEQQDIQVPELIMPDRNKQQKHKKKSNTMGFKNTLDIFIHIANAFAVKAEREKIRYKALQQSQKEKRLQDYANIKFKQYQQIRNLKRGRQK